MANTNGKTKCSSTRCAAYALKQQRGKPVIGAKSAAAGKSK